LGSPCERGLWREGMRKHEKEKKRLNPGSVFLPEELDMVRVLRKPPDFQNSKCSLRKLIESGGHT
jgi:hypothetical protein